MTDQLDAAALGITEAWRVEELNTHLALHTRFQYHMIWFTDRKVLDLLTDLGYMTKKTILAYVCEDCEYLSSKPECSECGQPLVKSREEVFFRLVKPVEIIGGEG